MSISVRKHIQWPPLPAAEKTSTLVLTSPTKQYYTDLRVLDPDLPPARTRPLSYPSPPSPVDRLTLPQPTLEWAFAGTAKSTGRKSETRKELRHTKWTHWLDSRTDEEDATDEADMWAYGDGETMERGVMMNPETGEVQEYEELWRDLDVRIVPDLNRSSKDSKGRSNEKSEEKVCMVLKAENQDLYTRGLIVRVGDWCQGILKVGAEISAERWRWVNCAKDGEDVDSRMGWERVVRVGEGSLPCRVLWEREELLVGNDVRSGGLKWEVVEKETWT